jgi:hypothetical protein
MNIPKTKIEDNLKPSEENKIAAVEHVIYEINQFLFCGRYLQKECGSSQKLNSELDQAVFESGLLHVRTLRDFLFNGRPGKDGVHKRGEKQDDLWSIDFAPAGSAVTSQDPLSLDLSMHLDKYLAHLSYTRAKARQQGGGYYWNWWTIEGAMLKAIKPFLENLEDWISRRESVPQCHRDAVAELRVTVTDLLSASSAREVYQYTTIGSTFTTFRPSNEGSTLRIINLDDGLE